jgi:hypothetical protein
MVNNIKIEVKYPGFSDLFYLTFDLENSLINDSQFKRSTRIRLFQNDSDEAPDTYGTTKIFINERRILPTPRILLTSPAVDFIKTMTSTQLESIKVTPKSFIDNQTLLLQLANADDTPTPDDGNNDNGNNDGNNDSTSSYVPTTDEESSEDSDPDLTTPSQGSEKNDQNDQTSPNKPSSTKKPRKEKSSTKKPQKEKTAPHTQRPRQPITTNRPKGNTFSRLSKDDTPENLNGYIPRSTRADTMIFSFYEETRKSPEHVKSSKALSLKHFHLRTHSHFKTLLDYKLKSGRDLRLVNNTKTFSPENVGTLMLRLHSSKETLLIRKGKEHKCSLVKRCPFNYIKPNGTKLPVNTDNCYQLAGYLLNKYLTSAYFLTHNSHMGLAYLAKFHPDLKGHAKGNALADVLYKMYPRVGLPQTLYERVRPKLKTSTRRTLHDSEIRRNRAELNNFAWYRTPIIAKL